MTSSDKPTIKDIYEAVEGLRKEIRECYVTKEEFYPVKSLAYGLASAVLLCVFGAVMALVVRASP